MSVQRVGLRAVNTILSHGAGTYVAPPTHIGDLTDKAAWGGREPERRHRVCFLNSRMHTHTQTVNINLSKLQQRVNKRKYIQSHNAE